MRGTLFDWLSPRVEVPRVDATLQSWKNLFSCLQRSAIRGMGPNCSYISVNKHVSSDNGKQCDGLEGFARTFLGLAFFLSSPELQYNSEVEGWIESYTEGLRNGTDPKHKDFWGTIDNPQLLVESASLALGILISGTTFWNRFSLREQSNLISFFRNNSLRHFWESNWLWFRIIHNLFLEKFGVNDCRDLIMKDLALLTGMYRGDGWYHDGLPTEGFHHLDYYNAYAMHFYGLLFSWLQDGSYKQISDDLKERARTFLNDYQHLFCAGSHPPIFGRSMVYRFANIAPWGIGILTDCCDIPVAQVKRFCIDTVNSYLDKGCVQRSGRIGSGVYQEQLFIREHYSGGGSPYWISKAFSLLMLPENHQFWQCEASDICHEERINSLASGDISTVVSGKHLVMVNHNLSSPCFGLKYNRFAYSNQFLSTMDSSFPVDNMLLLRSPGEKTWSFRSSISDNQASGNGRIIRWKTDSIPNHLIITKLVPICNGYLAYHRYSDKENLEFATGGFPLAAKDTRIIECSQNRIIFQSEHGWSVILSCSDMKLLPQIHHTKYGIGAGRVKIPYFSGSLNGDVETIVGFAIIAGLECDNMETAINDAGKLLQKLY